MKCSEGPTLAREPEIGHIWSNIHRYRTQVAKVILSKLCLKLSVWAILDIHSWQVINNTWLLLIQNIANSNSLDIPDNLLEKKLSRYYLVSRANSSDVPALFDEFSDQSSGAVSHLPSRVKQLIE